MVQDVQYFEHNPELHEQTVKPSKIGVFLVSLGSEPNANPLNQPKLVEPPLITFARFKTDRSDLLFLSLSFARGERIENTMAS